MQQIIECVPNFSDGRRPEVYKAIADSIRAVRGTRILDLSADPDHNRTVITFVGDLTAVEEAAVKMIATAAQLINLDEHEGEHPRLGATDVVPFIPVKGATIADCVALAQRVGQRVGDELGMAVYLYGAAATRPEREKLADIRKGQYEKWRDEIGHNPDRDPDYGPAEPKSWGATVIGVRPFLIAYNLYLNSDNVDAAKKIAAAVRFTSGGLRFVQAMGFLVEGQAQVSMNLTDFEKTPIHRVQEMVKREAARYGLTVTKAELVGLTPQKALLEAAKYYLQLDDLEDGQVLEIKLLEPEEKPDFTPYDLLAATAGATPTPGGGSSAAAAGALAAALTEMVANLTVGRKKYADFEDEGQRILARAAVLRQELAGCVMADAAAFDQLMAAWRNKELDEAAKAAAVEAATVHAGELPLQVARLSLEAAQLAQAMTANGNSNAITDAAAGAVLAQAAVQIAGMNVKINGLSLQDKELAVRWANEVDGLVTAVNQIAADTAQTAAQRAGF
jgi:glutamate formiminotransferase / formiminotetrahydrofolate cyclodeaminase